MTEAMSDLVEKVARAIEQASGTSELADIDWTREARAAIRAVLAHFAEAGNCGQLGVNPQVIAAAMAAALKEMESE